MNYCFKCGSCPSNIQPSQYTDVLCSLTGFTKQALHRQSPCYGIKDGTIVFSANFGHLSTSSLYARQLWSSVVGTATNYRMNGPGFESRWGQEIFPDRLRGPYSLLFKDTEIFSGLKWPKREVKYSAPSSGEVKNEWSHTSTPTVCLYLVY
jgi:hypothetical protein